MRDLTRSSRAMIAAHAAGLAGAPRGSWAWSDLYADARAWRFS